VHFRSAPRSASERLPLPIDLDRAHHSAVIALIDDAMVLDEAWAGYVRDLWEQTSRASAPHRLFPVSLSRGAFNLDPRVAQNNYVPLHRSSSPASTSAARRSSTPILRSARRSSGSSPSSTAVFRCARRRSWPRRSAPR
jgi:hypothetical protein